MKQQPKSQKIMLQLQDAILDTERLGELFLAVRKQKVECDRQRQELREGLTALKKSHQQAVWLTRPGGVMVKASAAQAQAIMEQDQRDVDSRLESLRAEEKRLTALLADKGATPQQVGPGMMNAMLNLRDRKPAADGGYDPNELD